MSSYFGINDVAVKAKNAYIGIKNIAKKIQKMYIGVNGVARLFFGALSSGSHSSAENIGEAPLLSASVRNNAATSVSKYAIFAGGYDPVQVATYDYVDSYDISITKYTTNLSDAVYGLSSGTVNDIAIFAGGANKNYGAESYLSTFVDSFDITLTKTPLENLDVAKFHMGSGTIRDYFLLVGGSTTMNEDNMSKFAEAYDTDLTKLYIDSLSETKQNVLSANTTSYLIFGGGNYSEGNITGVRLSMDAYDESLTVQRLDDLGLAPITSITINNQAIFICDSYTWIYNDNLTKTFIYTSTNNRDYTSVSIRDCAIICADELVYFYDSDLTRTQIDSLVADRSFMASASIGDYVLIGGGALTNNSTIVTQTVDVYKLN